MNNLDNQNIIVNKKQKIIIYMEEKEMFYKKFHAY